MQRDCPKVDVPLNLPCLHCEELFEADDDGIIDAGGSAFHRACWMHMIVGSIAHQVELCSCFRPADPILHDPSWMTTRQAAEEATRFFEGLHELNREQMKAFLIAENARHQ